MGWRDDAAADGVEQEGEQGEDPEDVACARAGAIGGPTRVGGHGFRPRGGDGFTGGGVVNSGGPGVGGGDGGKELGSGEGEGSSGVIEIGVG